MKIQYEKYDDTVQYLNSDKIPGWQPSSEKITVEVSDDELILTTVYEDGLIAEKKMTIIENNELRLVAQCLDEHMGVTVFVQDAETTEAVAEATLTLMNHNYIVGRYLRRVIANSEKSNDVPSK